MPALVYLNNHNVIELRGLTNQSTGEVVTDATVTCTLQDKNGTAVSGQTWPHTMGVVIESPMTGRYRGTLDNDLDMKRNRDYYAVVTATADGLVGQWTVPVLPATREGSE